MTKLYLYSDLLVPDKKGVHRSLDYASVPQGQVSRNRRLPLLRRNCSRRWICKALLALNIIAALALTIFHRNVPNYSTSPAEIFWLTRRLKLGTCKFPQVQPFSEEIRPYVGKPALVNCVHEASPLGQVVFRVDEGTRNLRQLQRLDSDCCYRPFYRLNDQAIQTDSNCYEIKENVTEIPLEHEFIEVLCVTGRDDYRDGFAFVQEKPNVEHWVEQVDTVNERSDANRLSLILLGIDATSRMNFLRTMPKSNKFLLKNLSAIGMNGYTKVAENTLPNVVPLLTGLTLQEFKDACVNIQKSHGVEIHLDNCPFIWKQFSMHGYRTSFAEDDVDIGIFNMDWGKAFLHPPTDFYLRPFSMRMQYKQSSEFGQCYGTRLSFEVLLDNIYNTALAFKNRLFFQFTWATKLSHSDGNQLTLGDQDLRKTLKKLGDGGHLNKTVLILMSDHGSRVSDIRSTRQGQFEDRMPLFYIVLPTWFKEKYPQATKNIAENSNRLTSPFDVHETLKDLMDLANLGYLPDADQLLEQKGISLFNEIPQNRSCFLASIPMHWCVCYDKIPVELDSPEVQDAVDYAVGSLNFLLKEHRSCATLRLDKITDASVINEYDVGDRLVDPGGAAGSRGSVVHQVSFITLPGDGSFEGTLIRDSRGAWALTEKIVRTNSYGKQSHCVEQDLKGFCFCTP